MQDLICRKECRWLRLNVAWCLFSWLHCVCSDLLEKLDKFSLSCSQVFVKFRGEFIHRSRRHYVFCVILSLWLSKWYVFVSICFCQSKIRLVIPSLSYWLFDLFRGRRTWGIHINNSFLFGFKSSIQVVGSRSRKIIKWVRLVFPLWFRDKRFLIERNSKLANVIWVLSNSKWWSCEKVFCHWWRISSFVITWITSISETKWSRSAFFCCWKYSQRDIKFFVLINKPFFFRKWDRNNSKSFRNLILLAHAIEFLVAFCKSRHQYIWKFSSLISIICCTSSLPSLLDVIEFHKGNISILRTQLRTQMNIRNLLHAVHVKGVCSLVF